MPHPTVFKDVACCTAFTRSRCGLAESGAIAQSDAFAQIGA
jgi:hypothetical protein